MILSPVKFAFAISGAILALSAVTAQATEKAYAEAPADKMTSAILTRWAAPEGITVRWEAQYDIQTAYATGKSTVPFEVAAPSAKEALVRFMARVRAEEAERYAAVSELAFRPPPLFACYYEQSKTFVVRQQGQRACGAGRTPTTADVLPANS